MEYNTSDGLPVCQNTCPTEFAKFMFRKINARIWGGNDRLCSLNRGKRVLFTVSAGWTRHSEWDKYRCRHNIYCSRYVDCAIYRGGVVGDRSLADGRGHTSARALSVLTATYRASLRLRLRPLLNNNVDSPKASRCAPSTAHLLRLERVPGERRCRGVPSNRDARLSSFRDRN